MTSGYRKKEAAVYRIDKDITRRCRKIRRGQRGEGPVVYWLSRDQRVGDNWALLRAQQEAIAHQKGLLVVFCLVRDYLGAAPRNYEFMLAGLHFMREALGGYNIPFLVLENQPHLVLPKFLRDIDAHLLVCDFDPLRIKRQWQQQVADEVSLPVYEVDTHNVIPAWTVSDKKEYGAYTIRPKINRLLDDYLTDIPDISVHPQRWPVNSRVQGLLEKVLPAAGALETGGILPSAGEAAALAAAREFIKHRLADYPETRNDPNLRGQSGLSPYLHFGHLSPQRLAWLVSQSDSPSEAREGFLEELIVRRELADNFCLYEPDYDNISGFPDWARKTLDQHRADKREFVYTFEEFREGKTHEKLWNACQLDLVRGGKLHGYLRMYWAKKILEWSPDPETAMAYALQLNDTYSLDGRDPNGYAGVAWSIGGVHDRAWKERPVFGKVRYMNEAGCRRKFDTPRYISSVFAGE